MGVLQRFERRLEGLVEGTFARVFGGAVQPVEVASALQREAEDKKAVVGPGRVLVPNEYVVELGRSDAARLGEYDQPLRTELEQMVQEHARDQGWSFVGDVHVRLEETDELATGLFRVRSSVAADGAARHGRPAEHQPRLEVGDRAYALDRTLVLGRSTEADVHLLDGGVSRRHASVDPDGTLTDLGSTNGTTVNGRAVTTALLQDGDVVVLGGAQVLYRAGG